VAAGTTAAHPKHTKSQSVQQELVNAHPILQKKFLTQELLILHCFLLNDI